MPGHAGLAWVGESQRSCWGFVPQPIVSPLPPQGSPWDQFPRPRFSDGSFILSPPLLFFFPPSSPFSKFTAASYLLDQAFKNW